MMEEKPANQQLTLENWSSYSLGDLKQGAQDEIWNRFVTLKQAEINTMLRLLPEVPVEKEPN